MRFFPPMPVNADVRDAFTLIPSAGYALFASNSAKLRSAGPLDSGALA